MNQLQYQLKRFVKEAKVLLSRNLFNGTIKIMN